MTNYWLARDADNTLFLFRRKPLKLEKYGLFFTRTKDDNNYFELDNTLFKSVTWENSPVKVEIKIKRNGTRKESEIVVGQGL